MPLPTFTLPARFGGLPRVITSPCGCEGSMAEERERLRAERSETLRRAWERTGVPAEYLDVAPDSARLESLDLDEGQGLYLHGTRGTGKTMVACAVLKAYVARNTDAGGWCSARFVSAPRWLSRMQDMMGRWGDSAEDEFQRAAGTGLLVFDDIGKISSRVSDWAVGKMFELVDARCSGRRPTIYTSKYDLGGLAERLELEDGDGETSGDIVSRIYRRSVRERFDGPDMRLVGGSGGSG